MSRGTPGQTIRCKVRVANVTHIMNELGEVSCEDIRFEAVTNDTPENKEWSKYTPSATFEMRIDNPAAIGKMRFREEFYVDFVRANLVA